MNTFWSAGFSNGVSGYVMKRKIGYTWELYLDNHDSDIPFDKGWKLSFKKAIEKCHKAHDALPAGFGIWEIEE
jgi:hypothetical protein